MNFIKDLITVFKAGFHTGFERAYGDTAANAVLNAQIRGAQVMLQAVLRVDAWIGPTDDVELDTAINTLLAAVRTYQEELEVEKIVAPLRATIATAIEKSTRDAFVRAGFAN